MLGTRPLPSILSTMSERVERILEALTEANDEVSYLVSPGSEDTGTPNATQVQGSMIADLLKDLGTALAQKGITPKPDFASALAQAGALAEAIETPTTSQAPSEGTVERVQEAYENVVEVGQRKKTLRPAPAPPRVCFFRTNLCAVSHVLLAGLETEEKRVRGV